MKKIFIVIILVLSAMIIFNITTLSEGAVQKNNKKPEVTKKLPKLLDLGAKKCIPCKKMAPILDKLAEEYKGVFNVEFVDVWQPENKKIAFAYKITSIPTQIFFDGSGKEIWRHVGFLSKEDILKKWKDLGFHFKPVKK